jgi:glycosyltransferase involved in cell wall biosynthesis
MCQLSVIICTHNPRPEYLGLVLDALRRQTFSLEQWELLLVDNASTKTLSEGWDVSWHPKGRHLREDELGLTPARIRGIAEAKSELLVFVDDDNVLSPTYLENALQIAKDWPILGAWGGTITGEFEIEPEPWARSFVALLAIREFTEPVWSNNPDDTRAQPCGAGMCVRASVAREYSSRVAAQPARRKLGRTGQSLFSGEDSDLVQTTCDLELGVGNFPQLVLKHLIPHNRVQLDYLIRLVQGITVSGIMLRYYKHGVLPNKPNAVVVWVRAGLVLLKQGRHYALIYKASQDATKMGIRAVQREKSHGAVGDRPTMSLHKRRSRSVEAESKSESIT